MLEHVDRGPGDRPGRQRIGQRLLVDDPAPGHVEQQGRRLHRRELALADEPAGLPVERHVDRDDVGSAQELVELDQFDPVESRLLGGHERVLAQDRHLHRPRPVGDGLADLAQADDAERPPAQLHAGQPAAGRLPVAGAHRRVPGRDPPGEPVQERQRVLGRGDRVAGRRVDDDDPGPGRGVEVDVVDAHAGPPDDERAGARRR